MQVQQKNLNEQIQNELRHMTDFSAPYHYGEDGQTFATPRIFGTIGRKLKSKLRSKKAVSLVMVILAATIMSILMIPITRWWVNLNSNLNQSEQRVAMQGAAQNVLADLSQESYDELIDYFVDDSDFHPGTASSKDDVLKNKTEPGYYKGTDPDTGDIAIWKLSIDENGVRTVTQYIYGRANEMIQDGIYNGSGVGYFMDNGECKRFSPASSSGYDPVTNMPEPCMKVGITVSDGTGRDYSTNTYKRSSLLRSIIPIGTVMVWPTADIPTYGRGVWLECNGQSFDRNRFPQLYETLGTTHVPDYQGVFLRGYGSQSYSSWRNSKDKDKSINYSSGDIGEIQNDAEIFWSTGAQPGHLVIWGSNWNFTNLTEAYPSFFPRLTDPNGVIKDSWGVNYGTGHGVIWGQAGVQVKDFPNTNYYPDIFLPQHPKHITYEPKFETVTVGGGEDSPGTSITFVADIEQKHEMDFIVPEEGIYHPSSEGVGWYHPTYSNVGMVPTADEVRPVNVAVKFMIKAK